jgi:hypothetical protein
MLSTDAFFHTFLRIAEKILIDKRPLKSLTLIMWNEIFFPHYFSRFFLQIMSSTKCPQCGLVNFATAQFCKRCNGSLANQPNSNNTQIINNSYNTSVRPTMPLRPQNSEPVQPPFVPQQPQHSQPYQPQPQYQPNQFTEQPNTYQSGDYTLPRFPQGQAYQPNQQQYQQPPYQQNQFMTPQNPQGVWRRGNEIVIHRNASFPPKCVKCGEDFSYSNNGAFATQKFRWHNPLVYIALISPLIYVILAAVLSERFSYEIPYCQTHLQERETTKNYLIGSGFGAVGLIVLLGWLGAGGWAFLVGLVAIFAIPIAYEYSYKPFRVKSVDGQYVYLQGAKQEYLNTLPY